MVAYAARQRINGYVNDHSDGVQDSEVIVVNGGQRQAQKRRYADAVQRVARRRARLLYERAGNQLFDIGDNGFFQLALTTSLGIHFFRHKADPQIVHDRKDRHAQHIHIIIVRQKQKQDLRALQADLRDQIDQRLDVVALVRDQQGLLVAEKEIGQRGIDQLHRVHHGKVDVLGVPAVDQIRQKRDQNGSDHKYADAYDAVYLFVKIQQSVDRLLIVLRDRLVHMVNHRDAEAHLGKRQHRQDRRKQTVQTQILRAQHVDDDRADDKRKNDQNRLVQHADNDISLCVFCDFYFHFLLPSILMLPVQGNRRHALSRHLCRAL